MSDSETNQLNLEWRAIVLQKLTSLEEGQQAIQKDITEIKLNYATNVKMEACRTSCNADIAKLTEDVEKLKMYRSKVAGMVIALNTVALVVGWFIEHFLAK